MSDVGLIMNGLLGVLLVGALALGWRLEGRLKTLRASHESFTRAVEDLDRAAARAEQGLADLRAATDEAAETLAGRIERATHLASRLEILTADAELAETRLAAASRSAPSSVRTAPPAASPVHHDAEPLLLGEAPTPMVRPGLSRDTAFARFAERYGAKPGRSPSAIAEAAARNDLILEDEIDDAAPSPAAAAPRIAPEAAARIERLRALARTPVAAAAPKPPLRAVDDELFDAPPLRVAGGAR
jgi:uncharacterized protein DUF6468